MSTDPAAFQMLLQQFRPSLVLPPDQPDETADSTLRALWQAAAGAPCSAKQAAVRDLPLLDAGQRSVLERLIAQRLAGAPLMQITGRASFMGLELEFAPDVFVVRPETELLAQAAIDCLRPTPHPVAVDDGCGSGNLSCAVASLLAQARVYAVDILESCAALTRRNVERCRVADRVSVHLGDLFQPLQALGLGATVDAVVSNPPYIASARLKGDRAYLVSNEPQEAFDGGPFGVRMQQRLIVESKALLKPGGHLLFEFGAGQDRQVKMLFDRAGGYQSVTFRPDGGGTNRVVVARLA